MKLRTWNIGLGIAGVVLWLLVWQWTTTRGPLASVAGLPTATDTFAVFFDLASNPRFLESIGETFAIALTCLLFATVIGVVLGVVTGLSATAYAIFDPILAFLRPLPPVVLLPLVLLLVGPSTELALVLGTFAASWPILVQVQAGVQSTDPVALDTATSMVLPWWRTQVNVVVPSAIPFIVTGVRIGAQSALLLSVGVGILAGAPGIGRSIVLAQELGQVTTVFAIILWSGVLGLGFALILGGIERMIVRGRRPSGVAA